MLCSLVWKSEDNNKGHVYSKLPCVYRTCVCLWGGEHVHVCVFMHEACD